MLASRSWPRGRVVAWLVATAVITAPMFVQGVQAQTSAPATGVPRVKGAAPKTAPKPAPETQAAQPPDQQIPELVYAPWTKLCLKGQEAAAKQVCLIVKDGRIESGQSVITAAIIEPEGEPKKILRLTVPLGMQLVHGTRVIIDSNAPAQSPYVACFQNGCLSDYEMTPEMLANMKKGQNLIVQAINANGSPLTLSLPLQEATGGFAKAYDGPPTDPKLFEETQKKLQEELQKRAAEARKKLEATPPAGANPSVPAR